MIIMSMCPLTKIFVPEMQKELLNNPSRVFAEEKFSFVVNTSRRDYRYDYSQPTFETNALLLNWLLGGDDGMQCQETDWTGMVKIDLDAMQNGAVLSAIAGMSKIDNSVQQSIEDAKVRAAILSQERVMKQIRSINGNMLKQYEINRQEGKSPYAPSATEYLCAFVLADEQKKNSADRQEIANKFAELLKSTFV